MGTSHTPGPWLIAETSLCGTSCDVLNSDGSAIIASVGCAEDHSDVHLIAAAPDLLEALKDAALFLSWIEVKSSPRMQRVLAAIAKAEGE